MLKICSTDVRRGGKKIRCQKLNCQWSKYYNRKDVAIWKAGKKEPENKSMEISTQIIKNYCAIWIYFNWMQNAMTPNAVFFMLLLCLVLVSFRFELEGISSIRSTLHVHRKFNELWLKKKKKEEGKNEYIEMPKKNVFSVVVVQTNSSNKCTYVLKFYSSPCFELNRIRYDM